MENWVEKAIKDEEEFFEEASDEEIEEALQEAGYEYYKDVEPEGIILELDLE